MPTADANNAREHLLLLIDQVNQDHRPILIEGESGSAVLVSESDWHAIEESLYLNGIPGMAASIQEGMQTSVEELPDSLAW